MSVDIPGGNQVLYAVAAAVIGGTSLFGGRGKPIHALLGGIVIGTVVNGLSLMGVGAAVQDIATAIVLDPRRDGRRARASSFLDTALSV